MSIDSPAIHALAQRVVQSELAARADEPLAACLERMFSRAQEIVAEMVGELGYLSLMARAARLTRQTFPWVPLLQASPLNPGLDFPRTHWQRYVEDAGAEAATACAALLFANAVGLLASFIGEDFTFRLIRRGWPDDGSMADRSEPGRLRSWCR
ncbi:MAG: hypothetical protein JWN48_4680 [Myxococcaceae bacterium]|nr:hypothetical protein [Myxococcaceae bacterium]